jgi:hypothetical protein
MIGPHVMRINKGVVKNESRVSECSLGLTLVDGKFYILTIGMTF